MSSTTVPFWFENPNILFHPQYWYEFFPTGNAMSYAQQLNAISRLVVVLTLFFFLATHSVRSLVFGAITLAAIVLVYVLHGRKEGFVDAPAGSNLVDLEDSTDPIDYGRADAAFESDRTTRNSAALASLAEQGKPMPDTSKVFDVPTSTNPFSNVLVTDYTGNPHKKPAPPSYNKNIQKTIMANAKKMVEEANPDQPDIADKLFKDLGEQFVFEQSLRPFHSTSNTTIPNDQEAFADFCYGSMISCKEGNQFACARNMAARVGQVDA